MKFLLSAMGKSSPDECLLIVNLLKAEIQRKKTLISIAKENKGKHPVGKYLSILMCKLYRLVNVIV